jgi:exopolyphosphatase/guanosine-5'-triphosphate,3'-diphosphate pyrophosphatase
VADPARRAFAPPPAADPAGGQQDFFPDQPRSFAGLAHPADRIGVIDIGSNSVRLVVYEGGRRSPAVVFNEKVMCGLGASLAATGALDPKGRKSALTAIRRFGAIASGLHVGALAAVATAAVRDSSDGAAFCAEVEAATGIRPRVASGEDEARFAALGVLYGAPGAEGVVVDLGGASLELCRIAGGRPGQGVTTPLGALTLSSLAKGRTFGADIAACLAQTAEDFRLDGGRLYLVGGSWRALARAHMERIDYPLRILHEYCIPADEALDLADWSAAAKPDALAALRGVSGSRAPLLPTAGRLLRHLVQILGPGDIMISSFGLREGVCLEHMPPLVRSQDPLIAGSADQEQRRARNPGFGAELASWVKTILPPRDNDEDRLIEAAARLVDVNWRTHPDYRVTGSFETVTRVTMTDLGHPGRAFIGIVLATRYKNSRSVLDRSRLPELLDRETRDRAVQIGLVFRLGVVLSGAVPGMLRGCRLARSHTSLELTLFGAAAELAGEEVEKRLAGLADALGLDWALRSEPGWPATPPE